VRLKSSGYFLKNLRDYLIALDRKALSGKKSVIQAVNISGFLIKK